MFGVKRKKHPMLGAGEKKGSAIDLDIGPPLDSTQTKNYRTIQQILIRSEIFWFTFISRIGPFRFLKDLIENLKDHIKSFKSRTVQLHITREQHIISHYFLVLLHLKSKSCIF
jgi:hypothetical protein